ncbi:MAG: rhamnulokinase [Roseiflexaceae bacterium]|nr:rhamnulokinase [Roseiflexaceae bacterium]
MHNFLAVDLGASSGRVIHGRWDGARFTLNELHRFENGGVAVLGALHWDILRLWAEIKRGIGVYAREVGEPLVSIGIDSWAVDYGLLDGQGQLLGNPRHYRDARTQGLPAWVDERVTRAARYRRTGLQLLPFNTLYQLASQARAGDPQLRAAETLLLIPDLLGYWLTGRKASEYTNASTTELLNCHTRQWDTELLERVHLPADLLPELLPAGSLLGPLLPELCVELGLPDVPLVVAPGTHDTASAVAGVPGLDEHSCYISSGTWSLVGLEVPEPITSAAALALNLTNEGGVYGSIRLLKNVGGMWLLQECQRTWARQGRQFSWDELLAVAAAAPPFVGLIDPDAPELLNPSDMPAAIGALLVRSGQPAAASEGALIRCCLESLALRYRWVIAGLEAAAGRTIELVRVVGGGSQNALLCQMTANACARPVVAGPVEATALGNLAVQVISAGMLPNLAAARAAIGASFPQAHYPPNDRAAWDTAYARWRALLDA